MLSEPHSEILWNVNLHFASTLAVLPSLILNCASVASDALDVSAVQHGS